MEMKKYIPPVMMTEVHACTVFAVLAGLLPSALTFLHLSLVDSEIGRPPFPNLLCQNAQDELPDLSVQREVYIQDCSTLNLTTFKGKVVLNQPLENYPLQPTLKDRLYIVKENENYTTLTEVYQGIDKRATYKTLEHWTNRTNFMPEQPYIWQRRSYLNGVCLRLGFTSILPWAYEGNGTFRGIYVELYQAFQHAMNFTPCEKEGKRIINNIHVAVFEGSWLNGRWTGNFRLFVDRK